MNQNTKKNELDIKDFRKKRRAELVEISKRLSRDNKHLSNLYAIEKKIRNSYEKIFSDENLIKYLEEFYSALPIKKTSGLRILCIEEEYFLEPISTGFGDLWKEYSYLDDQIVNLLGGKNFLQIPDTSKIHTLKFDSEKPFPRSIMAFPIVLNNRQIGCTWIGDRNYRAYSSIEFDEMKEITIEFQSTLSIIFKLLNLKKELITYKELFDSIEEPLLLVDKHGEIAHANTLAVNEFNLKLDEKGNLYSNEIDLINFSQNTLTQTQKITTNRNKEYDAKIREIALPESSRVYLYRFEDVSEKRQTSRFLSTIISSISQHLKKPLQDIKGLASLISSLGDLSEKQQEYLEKIMRNIDAVKLAIDELIHIDRMNKEGFVEIEKIDIENCITGVIHTLSPLINQKQLTINLRQEKKEQVFLCDRVLITHALLRIIDHAIQESKMYGEIEIDRSYPPNVISISVKDSGKGISMPEINKMMVDNEFDKKREGLEIAHRVAKLFGGKIIIESNLGSGAIVTLELPKEK